MKRLLLILLAVSVCLCFAGCGNDNSRQTVADNNDSISESDAKDIKKDETEKVIRGFFDAFEKADYEKMKTYCTDRCVKEYFHDDEVDGMVWAKLRSIDDYTDKISPGYYCIDVSVEMETAEASALYGTSETGFYVKTKQKADGSWIIDGFTTG